MIFLVLVDIQVKDFVIQYCDTNAIYMHGALDIYLKKGCTYEVKQYYGGYTHLVEVDSSSGSPWLSSRDIVSTINIMEEDGLISIQKEPVKKEHRKPG